MHGNGAGFPVHLSHHALYASLGRIVCSDMESRSHCSVIGSLSHFSASASMLSLDA